MADHGSPLHAQEPAPDLIREFACQPAAQKGRRPAAATALILVRQRDDVRRQRRLVGECQEFCVFGGRSGYVMAVLSP
jgi:hypothetical protein